MRSTRGVCYRWEKTNSDQRRRWGNGNGWSRGVAMVSGEQCGQVSCGCALSTISDSDLQCWIPVVPPFLPSSQSCLLLPPPPSCAPSLALAAGPVTPSPHVFRLFPRLFGPYRNRNRYENGDFSEPAGLPGPTQYAAVCRLTDLFIRPGAREEVNIRCVLVRVCTRKRLTTAFLPGR